MSIEEYFQKIDNLKIWDDDIAALREQTPEFRLELFGMAYNNRHFARSIGWNCGYYNNGIYPIDREEKDVEDFDFDDVCDYGVFKNGIIFTNLSKEARKVVDQINRIRHASEITLEVLSDECETTIKHGLIYFRIKIADFEIIHSYIPTIYEVVEYLYNSEGKFNFISKNEVRKYFPEALEIYLKECGDEDSE